MSSGPDEALAAHELDLVSRAAKGDAAAFDRFFERNAPSVQLLVERLLGPGEVADAVVLEAFEKTVRRLPLLGARNSSPALYVLSTARNGAYAALGRGRPTADGGPLAALLALPSRQRELLALRELGLPEADCAEVAGIDPSDVGPQVARARLRLTDELEGASLSTVFADDRAERLLAAEVVRVEGQPVSGALAQEISSHADSDARFAAALSAVRSPSRSVGQLPSVSGPARLAAPARAQAVVAVAGAAGAAAALASPASAGPTPAAPPVQSGPPSVPRSKSDPYDDQIGDEIAWGIVEEDVDGGFASPAPDAGRPTIDRPDEGQWSDGAGAVSDEAPTQFVPPAGAPSPAGPPPGGDASLADPFAGWDDALDWDEDEKEWAAGPAAAAAAAAAARAAESPESKPFPEPLQPATPAPPAEENTIAAAAAGTPIEPRQPFDPGETRAFDAVAAGLVDPDPIPIADFDHGDDEPPPRRSRWRWLGWAVALILLAAGGFFVAYAVQSARQDPDPPSSRLDPSTPATTTTKKTPTPTPKRSPSSSSSKSSTKSTTPSGSSSGSSSSSSSSTASGGSGSGSSGSGTTGSSGSSSGGSSKSSSGSGGSGGSGTTKKSTGGGQSSSGGDDQSSVVSGETSSGGSVRGDSDETGGTTP